MEQDSSPVLLQNRRPDLAYQFSWMLLGNLVYGVCQWAMVVVLVRVGTTVMVGQFSLGLAIAAPVFLFCGMQLRSVQVIDVEHRYPFTTYLSARVITSLLALVLVSGFVTLAGFETNIISLVVILSIAKAVESISDILFGLFQQIEQMWVVGTSMVVKGVLSLIVLGLVTYLTGSVVWGCVGLAISWSVVLLAYDVRHALNVLKHEGGGNTWDIMKSRKSHRDFKRVWEVLRYSSPLGIVAMLASLQMNIPRLVVERYYGQEQLGLYAAIAQLIVPGMLVVSALGQSTSARLANYYSRDIHQFIRLLGSLVLVTLAMGSLAVFTTLIGGRYILLFVYGPVYVSHVDVLAWLMAGGAVLYLTSCLEFGITATGNLKIQMYMSVVVTFIGAASAFVLVPKFGTLGAAWSLLAAFLVRLVVSGLVMWGLIYRKMCAQTLKGGS